jgi:hypothetical protein
MLHQRELTRNCVNSLQGNGSDIEDGAHAIAATPADVPDCVWRDPMRDATEFVFDYVGICRLGELMTPGKRNRQGSLAHVGDKRV